VQGKQTRTPENTRERDGFAVPGASGPRVKNSSQSDDFYRRRDMVQGKTKEPGIIMHIKDVIRCKDSQPPGKERDPILYSGSKKNFINHGLQTIRSLGFPLFNLGGSNEFFLIVENPEPRGRKEKMHNSWRVPTNGCQSYCSNSGNSHVPLSGAIEKVMQVLHIGDSRKTVRNMEALTVKSRDLLLRPNWLVISKRLPYDKELVAQCRTLLVKDNSNSSWN